MSSPILCSSPLPLSQNPLESATHEHSNTGMHDGHKHTYVHTETHIYAHGHTPMVLSVVDMELSRLSMELLCVACRLEMLLPRALDDITVLGSCLEKSE